MNSIYVSDLSVSRHIFQNYHFCRGNSNKRKTRIGIILKGSGTYIYLNNRLKVKAGDVVFVPENIYCYSEWHGDPLIEVVYLCCFIHYERFNYIPQILDADNETKNAILQIADMLTEKDPDIFEGYSLFYKLLKKLFPSMKQSGITFDKTLAAAIEYITDNWNQNFTVADIAKACCVSESAIFHLFQKELGETPINFLNSIRINIALEYLETKNCSISEVSRLSGFHSENHFRKIFSQITGTTPLKYKKSL